jgi:hypothetical protein
MSVCMMLCNLVDKILCNQVQKRRSLLHSSIYSATSRHSIVGIATSYGLNDREVGYRVAVGSRIFSSPNSPDRLWDPPSLLSSGYRGLFPRVVKLTTHLQLVPRSRKCGSIHPLPRTPSWRCAYLVKHRDNRIYSTTILSGFNDLLLIFSTCKYIKCLVLRRVWGFRSGGYEE